MFYFWKQFIVGCEILDLFPNENGFSRAADAQSSFTRLRAGENADKRIAPWTKPGGSTIIAEKF